MIADLLILNILVNVAGTVFNAWYSNRMQKFIAADREAQLAPKGTDLYDICMIYERYGLGVQNDRAKYYWEHYSNRQDRQVVYREYGTIEEQIAELKATQP